MGICCAQNSFVSDKKPISEIFEEVIQKSNRSKTGNPRVTQEVTSVINEHEIYLENSKILLSSNPKINVRTLGEQQEELNKLEPFCYGQDKIERTNLELKELQTLEHNEQYYGFWYNINLILGTL